MAYSSDGRMPPSAIRYTQRTGTQPRTQAPQQSTRSTQRMTYDIYADVEYNPVPRRGGNVQETSSLPRPRPNTTQDTAIRTSVNPLKPQLQPALPEKGAFRRKLVIYGCLSATSLLLGIKGLSTYNDIQLTMAQGPEPTQNLLVACGHGGDSPEHPTLLHAFIEEYVLRVNEYPAGKSIGIHGVVCDGLPTTGDYKKWELRLNAQKVQGSYQVIVSVQIPGQSVLNEWILIDSGKGYFVSANPK